MEEGFDWHVPGLTVGQVATRMKVNASAVRYYEGQGLISSDRTAGNQRRYHADVQCRVAMIRACQRVGLSIADIRDALEELPEGRVPDRESWERLAVRLRSRLHTRIDELYVLLDELAEEVSGP